MIDGWRCPGCGRIWAPFVASCGFCNRDGPPMPKKPTRPK